MLKVDNKKIFLDWDEIDRLVDILCKKIVTELPFIDSVTGLARGGLIPAVMISHRLNLPYVTQVSTNTLVVDDIADSGVTLEKSPGVYTAVLHYKSNTSIVEPSLYAVLFLADDWLNYPWERNDSETIQDYLNN